MCGNCPITAAFDVAEKLLAEFSGQHEDPESAHGLLVIHRRCAEAVQEGYPCSGPNSDQNGNVHCPLSSMIADVAAMAAYHASPIAVRPGPQDETETGQFL